MSVRIEMTSKQFASLRHDLWEPEAVVFMYARFSERRFAVVEVEAMPAGDIESRSDRHVVLRDDVRPRLIAKATASDLAIVEAHSHGPKGFAAFSASDLAGFEEWVPHFSWRLGGRPYAALVVAGNSWDALAWIEGPREPEPVTEITISRRFRATRVTPTGATSQKLRARRELA
jgi:hypothetical protein